LLPLQPAVSFYGVVVLYISKLLHEVPLWRLKESFLQAVSGQIGKNAVSEYMQLLRDAGELCFDDSYFKLLFRQSLFASGDIWRRCCLSTMSFPFCMFGLIREEYTVPEFFSLWADIMKVKELCPHCVDAEFSLPLLRFGANFASLSDDEKMKLKKQIQAFLTDIAVRSPLSTDRVENKHGEMQNVFCKFRGACTHIETAVEESMLHNTVKDHCRVMGLMVKEFLPPNWKQIKQRSGRIGCNQYTSLEQRTAQYQKPEVQREHIAMARDLRRLAGSQLHKHGTTQHAIICVYLILVGWILKPSSDHALFVTFFLLCQSAVKCL
jgi:hypothetical protein